VVLGDAGADGDETGLLGEQPLLDERVVVVDDLDADLGVVALAVVVEEVPDLGVSQGGTEDGDVLVGSVLQDGVLVVEGLAEFPRERRGVRSFSSAKNSSKKS